MTMDSNAVNARIEELVYTIQFTLDLGDNARVAFVAEGIETQRGFRRSAGEYSEAIASALARGRLSPRALAIGRHPESDMLNWIARLGERLTKGSAT
jgi:hypothetical protein